jgi:hypothetical protein
MSQTSQRGGAQVGWLSASWPLAGIKIEPARLTVSALGSYTFNPSEVSAIEPVGSIPVLTTGIRIHHMRPDYPEKVIFYSMGRQDSLLQALRAAGFTVGRPTVKASRGFPVKIGAILVAVLVWNLLFFLDRQGKEFFSGSTSGPYSLLALVLAFLVATFTPYSSRLQDLILREDHDVGEIRGFLRLLQLVSAVLAISGAWSLWSQ